VSSSGFLATMKVGRASVVMALFTRPLPCEARRSETGALAERNRAAKLDVLRAIVTE